MKSQRKRVKTIRTRECTVRVISQRGKPDRIRIVANRETLLEVGYRGVTSPRPVSPFGKPEINWKQLMKIGS